MGHLHEGHLELVHCARGRCDRVLATVFVNPLQFGEDEDFDQYPRNLENDSAMLQGAGADALFAPTLGDMYPRPPQEMTQVQVPGLSAILCGASRPVHFGGVTTVVSKLFNIVQPDLALFGQKDFQQLTIIRRMVLDLAFPVEVVGVPTVREPDGLAMSSRNSYLSEDERVRAPFLYATLRSAMDTLCDGRVEPAGVESEAMQRLTEAGFRPDYVAVRRRSDLHEPRVEDRELVILAAAWLGKARLIDNLSFDR